MRGVLLMLKEKLEEYGFYDFQIEKLLKKGKLNTGQGDYTLKDNKLVLVRTADGTKEEIDL